MKTTCGRQVWGACCELSAPCSDSVVDDSRNHAEKRLIDQPVASWLADIGILGVRQCDANQTGKINSREFPQGGIRWIKKRKRPGPGIRTGAFPAGSFQETRLLMFSGGPLVSPGTEKSAPVASEHCVWQAD